LLVPEVVDSDTTWDAGVRIEALRKTINVRDRSKIPI
jgi:hypothetical protein